MFVLSGSLHICHVRQEIEAGRFLLRTLDNPKGLLGHVKTSVSPPSSRCRFSLWKSIRFLCRHANIAIRMTGALILHMIYGYSITPNGRDPLLSLGHQMDANFSQACLPGKWFVDMLPFLSYLPDWVPCTRFKQVAKQMKAVNEAVAESLSIS